MIEVMQTIRRWLEENGIEPELVSVKLLCDGEYAEYCVGLAIKKEVEKIQLTMTKGPLGPVLKAQVAGIQLSVVERNSPA